MCDGKGPTFTLFKIQENGECIGGFTKAQWTSPEKEQFKTDPTAMLFNLSTRQNFQCQNPKKAIACWKNWGPYFGDGELYTFEPFNQVNQCCSYINRNVYGISKNKEDKSMLTNLPFSKPMFGIKCDLTISELEVWEVVFEN